MENSYASIGQRLENKEELVFDIQKRNTPKFQAKIVSYTISILEWVRF